MQTALLKTGRDALGAQGGTGPLLTFSGFAVGPTPAPIDFNDPTVDNAVVPIGGTVYMGTDADMEYVRYDDDTAIIRCIIKPEVPQHQIGNIMLFVEGQPFSLSFAPSRHIKLSTNGVKAAGERYTFQAWISIPNLSLRMSFANLSDGAARFNHYPDENSLPWPWWADNTRTFQSTIEMHSGVTRTVPLIHAWSKYWGCPLAMRLDDEDFWWLDGGEAGDGYVHTPNV